MNILFVRPLISQIISILTTTESVSAFFVWDTFQDPCLNSDSIKEFPDIPIFEYKENQNNNPFHYLISIIKTLSKNKFDIIHLNGLRDIPFFYLGRMFVKNKPKIVATSRNPIIWSNDKKIKLYIHIMNILLDGYIPISKINKNIMEINGFPSDKISYIPNSFVQPINPLNNVKLKTKDKLQIIYVASIDKRKSQMTLVDALENLVRDYKNIRTVFVGSIDADPAYYSEVSKRVSKLGLESSVVFVGKVSHKEVIEYYLSSDIVAFPSLSEMMPRAIIEAMWLGKPVIASAVDGIPDLITDHETGLLFPPGDSNKLEELMRELIEDPELSTRLGAEGQKYVKVFCSPENVGNKYIEFYKSLMEK